MKNLKVYSINKVTELFFLGRNSTDSDKKNERVLFYNGSGFEVHFKGRELWVQFESNYGTVEPWIAVFINGSFAARRMVEKGKHWVCIARGTDDSYEADVLLMKDSQVMSDDPTHILKIKRIAASKKAVFTKPAPHKLKIEFIGDSITTGEGLCGAPGDMTWNATNISFMGTYAFQTARILDADFRVMSQGGWGVISGYNNNPNFVIPPHYEDVCSIPGGKIYRAAGGNERYDFSKWKADCVVINLGTNDRGGFASEPWIDPVTGKSYKLTLGSDGFPVTEDAKKLARGVYDFLCTVRKNNPDAKIIWATGMMSIPQVTGCINEGIESYKKEHDDSQVFSLSFDSMDAETCDEERGSRGHPGPKTHKLAAQKLSTFIKQLLGII